MSLEVVVDDNAEYSDTGQQEITEDTSSRSNVCLLSSSSLKKHIDGKEIESENVFAEIDTNTISLGPSGLVQDTNDNEEQKILQQNIIAVDGNSLVNFPNNGNVNNIQVLNNNGEGNTAGNNNGTIYLLVSSNETQTFLQPVEHHQLTQHVEVPTNSQSQTLNILSTNSDDNTNLKISGSESDGSIVQVMNTDGVPISLNVNDLLSSIQNNKSCPLKKDSILSLSTSILSTTANGNTGNLMNTSNQIKSECISSDQNYIINTTGEHLSAVPNWALHLSDCTLCGDTYTGYVATEHEMDAVLNLYKKETQNLFAIRQTPSPAKDESSETVRLMWKSQHVPYDGIPFVNVGRRATVMECEHGPRKRSNALKRMAQMSGKNLKKIPNLTCPARLFVKKVKKFPQYQVPREADAKVIRGMQEHALKMVRSNGIKSGEIRYYMQLPLPSSHRYHHIGNSMEAFQKELDSLENLNDVLMESVSVDNRVHEHLQILVRQGYTNPFQVRGGLKEFVEKKMELALNESRPVKHNKAFYPTLIEIQNMVQQAEAAIEAGILTKLPKPEVSAVPIRQKRKRTQTVESPGPSSSSSPATSSSSSSLVIKRMKIDIPAEGSNLMNNELKTDAKVNIGNENDQNETIALTLTDSQLENFSVTNFSYDQLAQLAKIGLIALNNAAKDDPSDDGKANFHEQKDMIVEPISFSTSDGESILIVTPNNAEEEKARLRVLTGQHNDKLQLNTQTIPTNVVIDEET